MAIDGSQPPSVPASSRVIAPILVIGGVLNLLVLLVPGYVLPDPWIRDAELTQAVVCLLTAALCYRYGLPPRLLMAVALIADVATTLTVFTMPGDIASRTCPAIFTLPAVVVALYGTRLMLTTQVVAAAAGTTAMLVGSAGTSVSSLTQAVSIWLTTTGPGVAVWVLRSRLERAVEQERRRSVTDPLTAVGNRRAVDSSAPGLLLRARAEAGVLGVAVVDVDHFKRVNDRYGHRVGDEVIVEVSQALTATVGADDLVVRLGGEEFAVFAVMSPDDLAVLGERIRTAVARHCSTSGVTVSLGLAARANDPAALTEEADPAEALWRLVEEADALMYLAKREGRNRVRAGIGGRPEVSVPGSPLPA
jgi:diguanylate cyclase (GGDEF)-like protein